MTSTGTGAAGGPLLPAGCALIVGVVNITEDSFSDGGRYLDPALAHAEPTAPTTSNWAPPHLLEY
jgi:hypothetical protein